jgi:hypothetical protein
MNIVRTLNSTNIPVWQGGTDDISLVQGGFALVTTGLPVGSLLRAGTPLAYDETARTATILKGGFLYATAGATDTVYKLVKNSPFVVGDFIALGAIGGKAFAITAIDTTNAAYDNVTVGTTIGAGNAGDAVWQSTATGATASALPAGLNGLLYEDTFTAVGISVSAVFRGTIYARRVVYTTSIAAIAALSKIVYSQSK